MHKKGRKEEKKALELERLLEEARQEAQYYRKIAGETGRKRLREIDQLSRLIGDLKNAEEALRKSEERYRNLFENSTAATMIIEEDTTVSMVNTEFENQSGYSKHEIEGRMSWTKFVHPDDVESMKEYHCKRRRGKETPREYEFRFIDKKGNIKNIFIRVDMIPGTTQSIASLMDITSRKIAEEALQREKEKFRILVEESPFGVCIVGKNNQYKYINPQFTEIFGYTLEDVPNGKEWFKKAYPDEKCRARAISMWKEDLEKSKPGQIRPRPFTVTCKNGTEKVIQFRSVTLKTGDQMVIFEDITQQKQIEAQLLHAQKMEAIGTLAGGIAHDFNNLLMGIQGRTSLLLLDTPPSHPHYEELKKIEDIIKSAADLTNQLLGFARGGKYEVKVSNPNDLIEKSLRMFGRTRKDIRIHEKYEEEVWLLEVDASQIEQVFLNLYINAWQAMPHGGDLYIETENVELKAENTGPFQLRPGKYVRISVTDTGIGMEKAVLGKIFEPFFTTKNKKRGMGLGLASAYGIIKNHNGIIDVKSKKAKGSTFNVYLPASEKVLVKKEEPATEIIKGTETILLVDDENRLIEVGEKILTKMGYRVHTANSGRKAVELYDKNPYDIDLVILDIIMPGMGGEETFNKLKEINPNVKVLLSSGYSVDDKAIGMLKQGCHGFIQKPFRAQDLSEGIRKILLPSSNL